MKKVFIIFFAVILTSPVLIYAESFGQKYDKIVTFFQGETEPAALDAIWDSKTSFKIGVIDDGSNWDNYANHTCEILDNEDFKGQKIEVKIIDIQKLAHKKKWVTLGHAICK
jgi:hypothetical protein